jgi:hypothetical protein
MHALNFMARFLQPLFLVAASFLFIPQGFGSNQLPACQGSNQTLWTNCYGSYYYTSGAHYDGEYRDGKANGRGTFTFTDGGRQEGFWQNDRFAGTSAPEETRPIQAEIKNPTALVAPSKPKSNSSGPNTPPAAIQNKLDPLDQTRKKCARLGLSPGSDDYKLCMRST